MRPRLFQPLRLYITPTKTVRSLTSPPVEAVELQGALAARLGAAASPALEGVLAAPLRAQPEQAGDRHPGRRAAQQPDCLPEVGRLAEQVAALPERGAERTW